jgi:hypothetical protein
MNMIITTIIRFVSQGDVAPAPSRNASVTL